MTCPAPHADRLPPEWGGQLTENDYAVLSASWITPELADRAMLRRVDTHEGREVIGQKGNRDCAGILIPYYWPGEPRPFNYRLRRDNPDYKYDAQGRPKPHAKYLGPAKSGNRLYIPPGVTPEQLQDGTAVIALVEGEKKALALWRLANYQTDKPRFISIALAGVWNWCGNVGKANGPKGERVDVKGPIPDLNRIEWTNRTVFIVFDANVHSNDSVTWARRGIARELVGRAAEVKFVDLPEDCGVNGIDDLLAAWGTERVLELFENSLSGACLHVVPPPQFKSGPEGMFREITKGEKLSRTQLTNFQASIKTSITLDDGLDAKREFEIAAELMGRRTSFTISASQFAAMDWPLEQMGAGAITFPHQKEYARAAIQSFSMTAPERCVYIHTGWRKIEGEWLYLHTAGAIGAVGVGLAVSVRLTGPLSRYELALPETPESLVRAVQASLRTLELAPAPISFPMRAATIRAVFGDSDFSVHLAGATGVFKSELAALEQQHFGAGMNSRNLPASWSSTSNALEALTFHAKDALIVIDDFAPHGSTADVARYHAAADRVFRAAGNHAGRGRLDSSARFREPKPPRALILSTGEDIPHGQSVRARLLILELSKGTIDTSELTECQQDSEAGIYSQAMAGFVRWIAAGYEDKRAQLDRRSAELRHLMQSGGNHARTPDIIAQLQAGFEQFLAFAEEFGAITHDERYELMRRCWDALSEAGAAQTKHQSDTEPTARYISLIRGCLASGRAHLASRGGTVPDWLPESCGWRGDGSSRMVPQGDCIGWIDGEDIYLEPMAAHQCAQNAARNTGEDLAVSPATLRRRLREKGLLASVDEKRQTITIRRTICGSSKDVVHFLRSTLLPGAPSDENEDVG
jgi:hypothetical protein